MATNEDYPDRGQFQPRVDAEEGDPTRGDYVIGAAIALVVVALLLWAFGVIHLPWSPTFSL